MSDSTTDPQPALRTDRVATQHRLAVEIPNPFHAVRDKRHRDNWWSKETIKPGRYTLEVDYEVNEFQLGKPGFTPVHEGRSCTLTRSGGNRYSDGLTWMEKRLLTESTFIIVPAGDRYEGPALKRREAALLLVSALLANLTPALQDFDAIFADRNCHDDVLRHLYLEGTITLDQIRAAFSETNKPSGASS